MRVNVLINGKIKRELFDMLFTLILNLCTGSVNFLLFIVKTEISGNEL